MIFKEIKSSSLKIYESSVLDLIGKYYENPLEIVEMIGSERIVYMSIDNNDDVSSILTCKTQNYDRIIISYLGLLVSSSKNKTEIGALMFRHLENLYNQSVKNINKIFSFSFIHLN